MNGPVVLGLILKALFSVAYDVERTTKLGPVGGRNIEVLGKTVEEYRGIPYAKPPVGELRFKPPVQAERWDEVLDATNGRTGCPQHSRGELLTGDVTYTEDCLYLNVWTTRKANERAPVLVWIYGGGFTFGSASYDNYTGAVIAARTGCVVVSMNYRVGILGFLNADSPEAPGNMGLLDQHMALVWVKKNIKNFGGDPSRVTLFGESAGAMSAHAHVLSPMSRGLFRRAVMLSGTMNTLDFVDAVHESVSMGDAVAAIVGCSDRNQKTLVTHPEDVVNCLRTKSADELVTAAAEAAMGRSFPFVPTYHDEFLPKVPAVAIDRGFFANVDVLTGVTSDEGFSTLFWPSPRVELMAEQLEHMDEETLRRSLQEAIHVWTKKEHPEVLKKYTSPATDKPSLRRQYLDYISDILFVCPMHAVARKHASRGNAVYTYVFGHWPVKRASPPWAGVGHGMELSYLFGMPLLEEMREHFGDEDVLMSEKFINMIATFAEKGAPESPSGTAWPKYTSASPVSLLLVNGNGTEVEAFGSDRCEFWSQHI